MGVFMSYCCLVREDKASLEIEKEIKTRIKLSYNDVDPEIVVAIGGDGTIIKASHLYPNAIIFGIHTGHLGFYANYSVDELDLLIDDINNKNYCIEKLKLLSCEIEDSLGNVIKENALNEITVVTPPRTLTLDVKIDGEFLERFRGTGLCISTSSGSTVYNKLLKYKLKIKNLNKPIQSLYGFNMRTKIGLDFYILESESKDGIHTITIQAL